MKLIDFKKVKDGKYLKNYELTYENKNGKHKVYEIVSRKEINDIEKLGNVVNGISIVAICDGKLLLLKEFRMGVNRVINNLCAGMLEDGETVLECINRELHEETGLYCEEVIDILPPSFAAVAIADTKTQIVIVKAGGTLSRQYASANEQIQPGLYTKEEVKVMLANEEFSSRAQIIAYFFSKGKLQ